MGTFLILKLFYLFFLSVLHFNFLSLNSEDKIKFSLKYYWLIDLTKYINLMLICITIIFLFNNEAFYDVWFEYTIIEIITHILCSVLINDTYLKNVLFSGLSVLKYFLIISVLF